MELLTQKKRKLIVHSPSNIDTSYGISKVFTPNADYKSIIDFQKTPNKKLKILFSRKNDFIKPDMGAIIGNSK